MNPYGVTGQFVSPNDQVGSYYGGVTPYGSYPRPGVMRSAWGMVSPFDRDPVNGDVGSVAGAYANSLSAGPMDAAAWIGQRIAVPAAAMGIASAYGGSALGSRLGNSFGAGIARGIGFRAGGAVAGGMGAAAGLAGSFIAPLAIGMGVSELVNQAVFKPYAATRAITEHARSVFGGVSFAGAQGGLLTGRGLGRMEATNIGIGIGRAGWSDRTFSNDEFHSIAQGGMRAGLFDDVGSGQIVNRVKSIAAQVKTLIAISKDLSVNGAIEELARLRLGGASVAGGVFSAASGAYSGLGMSAGIAGTSVSALMARVGSPAAGMFQSAGMTPYLGSMAAGGAYASFATAERLGLMSTSHLARLGGGANAALTSLAGQMTAASNPYAMMGLHNRFFGSGPAGSALGTSTTFARSAASDPLTVAGQMGLYGGAMQGMAAQDPRYAERRAIELARSASIRPAGPNGTYTAEQLYSFYRQLGMSQDQIQAYVAQRATETDPAALEHRLRSIRATRNERVLSITSQEKLYSSFAGQAAYHVGRGGNAVGEMISGLTSDTANRVVAGMGDAADRLWSWMSGAPTQEGSAGAYIDESGFTSAMDANIEGSWTGGKQYSSRSRMVVQELMEEARKEGPRGDLARKIISGKMGSSDSKALLNRFIRESGNYGVKGKWNPFAAGNDEVHSDVKGILGTEGVVRGVSNEDTNSALAEDFKWNMPITVALKDTMSNLKVLGQAQRLLTEASEKGISISDDIDGLLQGEGYAELRDAMKPYADSQKVDYINQMDTFALKKGLTEAGALAQMKEVSSVDEIKKYNQGRIHGRGMFVHESSETGRNALRQTALSSLKEHMRALDAAQSGEASYESFRATQSMLNAAEKQVTAGRLQMEAAEMFLVAAGKDVGKVRTALGQNPNMKIDS